MNGHEAVRAGRSDRVGLWIFNVLGIAIAASAAVMSTARVLEFFRRAPVDIDMNFSGTTSNLVSGGATYEIELTKGVLSSDNLPTAAVVAGVAQAIVMGLAVIAIVVCLLLLSARVMRGQVFGRVSTFLILVAGISGLVGAVAFKILGGILAVEAFQRVSAGMDDLVIAEFDLGPFILAGFVIALLTSVFTVGDRLQRETEGLV